MNAYPSEYDDTIGDEIADFCIDQCTHGWCEWADLGTGKPCKELEAWLKKKGVTLSDE